MSNVYATHEEGANDPEECKVWTISTEPNEPGWETDGGYSGYGLTKQQAEFYAKCINYCIEHGIFKQE